MAVNRGKKFEDAFRASCEKVPGISIDRLHDQTTGYLGSSNICDFIVYKQPYEYYFECKSVHGNTLSIFSNDPTGKHIYGDITNKQWTGLREKSPIPGVYAGVVCWWIDHDQTWFIPIDVLEDARNICGHKSINITKPHMQGLWTPVDGIKKRVFFDYNIESLLINIRRGDDNAVQIHARGY